MTYKNVETARSDVELIDAIPNN